MAKVIALNSARVGDWDYTAAARSRFARARAATGASPGMFAARLGERLGWPVSATAVEAWERTGTPPGDVLLAADAVAGYDEPMNLGSLQLIGDTESLRDALTAVVTGAHEVLAVTGSRSREPGYLTQIELAATSRPALTYWRVLYGLPRHGALRNHLMRLIDLELPPERIRVGLVKDTLRDQERHIIASEREAVVILPSIHGIMDFDTALRVSDPLLARSWVRHVQDAWQAAEPLATRAQIEALEVVR